MMYHSENIVEPLNEFFRLKIQPSYIVTQSLHATLDDDDDDYWEIILVL